jgi:hypothetical protein
LSDPAPGCCAVGIALGRELVGARGGLLLGLIAIAPEHQGRGAPDIDFRYHGRRLSPIVWLRRLATMSPAFIVVAVGVDPTEALVLSQVVLSAALPFPMIALVYFTGRADILGRFVNHRATQIAAIGGTILVLTLNLFLIVESFTA